LYNGHTVDGQTFWWARLSESEFGFISSHGQYFWE